MPVLKNAKHELFCQGVAKGKTSDQAYVIAGYHENRNNASRLRANETISKRIEELLNAAADKAGVSIERTLREFASIGYAPHEGGPVKVSDKIGALNSIGRHLGMFSKDNERAVTLDLAPPSDEETAQWMAFMLAKGRRQIK